MRYARIGSDALFFRLTALIVIAVITFAQPKQSPPRFDHYPAVPFTGKVAMPKFLPRDAKDERYPDHDFRCTGDDEPMRRALFEDAVPNFAGHFVIEGCTCGTGCSYPFMWDARTGRLYRKFPFWNISVGPPWSDWRGLLHNVQSKLLIAEGYLDDEAEDPKMRIRARSYYVWNGTRFALIYRVPLPPVDSRSR